jgi:hypothetical protein
LSSAANERTVGAATGRLVTTRRHLPPTPQGATMTAIGYSTRFPKIRLAPSWRFHQPGGPDVYYLDIEAAQS